MKFSFDNILSKVWVLLLGIQILTIVILFSGDDAHGFYNRDAFSYTIQWTSVAETGSPFSEPVLKDPGHDLSRILFSMPHFLLGTTARFFDPVSTYLIWSCVGLLTTYFSIFLFARALGFNRNNAYLVALIQYTFFHLLSQLPPLSLAQARYVLESLSFDTEFIQQFGPRQYPHDIFFYPLLYTLLALTLYGARHIRMKEDIKRKWILVWMMLCLMLPFNYLYHWFTYAFVLLFMCVAGLLLGWWKVSHLYRHDPVLTMSAILVGLFWVAVLIVQNNQLHDPEGYRFALMGGLTEARFLFLPVGLLVRIILWSVILLSVIKLQPKSLLLIGVMVACVVLMNLQFFAGKNVQPGHWSFGIERIFAWILTLIVVYMSARFLKKYKKPLVAGALVMTFFFFCSQTIISWKHYEIMSRWNKERREVITYLKTLPSSVILAPEIWLETDVLIHTCHYSFLPRAAQSAISHQEQMQRLTRAALLMRYSEEGFIQWLHIRDVRFFGMLYRTDKDFSSSLYFDPSKRHEVIRFGKGDLPSWDRAVINQYLSQASQEIVSDKALDLVVLHRCEAASVPLNKIMFENAEYVVGIPAPLPENRWGEGTPIDEMKYPISDQSCHSSLIL